MCSFYVLRRKYHMSHIYLSKVCHRSQRRTFGSADSVTREVTNTLQRMWINHIWKASQKSLETPANLFKFFSLCDHSHWSQVLLRCFSLKGSEVAKTSFSLRAVLSRGQAQDSITEQKYEEDLEMIHPYTSKRSSRYRDTGYDIVDSYSTECYAPVAVQISLSPRCHFQDIGTRRAYLYM